MLIICALHNKILQSIQTPSWLYSLWDGFLQDGILLCVCGPVLLPPPTSLLITYFLLEIAHLTIFWISGLWKGIVLAWMWKKNIPWIERRSEWQLIGSKSTQFLSFFQVFLSQYLPVIAISLWSDSLDSETSVYMAKFFSSCLSSETWDIPKAKCSYLPEHGPFL